MNDLEVINLEGALAILGSKLVDDKEFVKTDLINLNVEKPVELDEVSLSFGLNGNFNVQLFNSPDDADQDEVIGKAPDSVIPMSPDRAWLKYQATSAIKAAAGLELSNVGFDITGEKVLQFMSYRLHSDLQGKLRDAVLGDFKPFALITNIAHIKALQPGEVLAMSLPGKLSLEVSVAWSDLFTGAFNAFQKLLQVSEVVNFELSASVEVAFRIVVDDDCRLHIRKNDDETYQVFYSKNTSRQIGGTFAAGVEVGFQDPDAARQVLGSVVEGLVGKFKGKIQPILDKNPLNKLTDEEKQLAWEVAEALGLQVDAIQTVADFIRSLEAKIGPTITDIATSKIKLGFAYEYNRIAASKELFQASLSEAALEKYHPGLIRFKLSGTDRFSGLITDLRAAEAAGSALPGVTLVNYLNEKTIRRQQSWGFSLGIGKWKLTGLDHQEISEVVRQNIRGNRQIAFKGTRSYEGNLFGNQYNWVVDFNAEMDRFSQLTVPLVNELKYGLFLMAEWKRNNDFNAENIRHIADHAVLWNIIDPEQFAGTLADLQGKLTGGKVKNVRATAQVTFKPEVFPILFNKIAWLHRNKPETATDLLAKSLAAAMSYHEDYAVRKLVSARISAYAPLWKACLLNAGGTDQVIGQDERMELAFAAGKRLKELGEFLLAKMETDPDVRNAPGELYFSSLLAMNPNVRTAWSAFKNGLIKLSDGYSQGLIYEEVVGRSFRGMQQFWQQSHYIRTLGHYLLTFTDSQVLMQDVERSLTIRYERDGEPQTIELIGKLA